jgi:transposase-like protein
MATQRKLKAIACCHCGNKFVVENNYTAESGVPLCNDCIKVLFEKNLQIDE